MADQFQTFDKKPIVEETITFRAWRFGFREMILAGIIVLLFILCIVFAGLFGRSSVQLRDAHNSLIKAQNVCKDSPCLQTSGYLMEHLNVSIGPCDNFFRFACGGYEDRNPLDRYTYHRNVLKRMYQLNQARLTAILEGPAKRFFSWSSERKLKDFFRSCTDDFRREQMKAQPLLDKVFPLLGGWYVLDASWSSSTWDLHTMLKTVQTDMLVDALFAPRPRVDQFDSKKRVIVIYPGGTGKFLRWSDYTSVNPTDKQKKLQKDYKTFIRTVATFIARDAGVNRDNSLTNRIDVFVDDVFKVESKIATFASNSRYQRDAFSEARKIALDDLKGRTNNVIDWTLQMSYLFNQAGVTGNTKVVVPYPTYLGNLSAIIQNLPARNRMLHNYLTWRVLERYVQDLSWEYVHANRQLFVDKYGYQNFLGTQKYCFSLAKRYFNIALGALYVETSFDERNKKKVTDITETVKTALETMLTKNTWMDQSTKDFAISKMKGSTYKIGYPDFMGQQSKVDALYEQLNINASDFFGNLLNLNQQHRREWNRQLREGEDRSQWLFNTYDTNMAVYWYWDEIIVPAGILQFPMYTYAMPHYYSFGAIGSLLGHFVHHLIDEKGRRWDKGGDFIKDRNGWWSNQTVQNYNVARQCVADVYNNITQGPYYFANGETKTIDVNGDQYAGEAMAVTTGIRLAYNAYQLWQQKHGQDPYPPGLSFTPQQLFFIAHAQVFCYNRDPFYDYIYTLVFRNTNEETRVNVALMELPEFRQAFRCRASDGMVSPKPCTYY